VKQSCQPVKIVGNLIDLSRHVVIDLSGCMPTHQKTKKSCELGLVRKLLGKPGCQLRFPTSLQLVLLVECGLNEVRLLYCYVRVRLSSKPCSATDSIAN